MAEKNYGVIEINTVASQTNHAYLRNVINATDDIQDGQVFQLLAKSADKVSEGEVWVATKPATDALNDMFMASGLIDIKTGEYRNLNPNPQRFVNTAGTVFDAFYLSKKDLVTITAESLGGTFSDTMKYVNATADTYALTWGATQTADATSLKYIGTSYISIGNGTLGSTQRVVAYQFEVAFN